MVGRSRTDGVRIISMYGLDHQETRNMRKAFAVAIAVAILSGTVLAAAQAAAQATTQYTAQVTDDAGAKNAKQARAVLVG